MGEKFKLEISTWTIVKFFLVAIVLYLLYLVFDVVALFFVVLILTATFSPVVKSWQKHLGRTFSIALLFIIFLIAVAAAVYIIIPPLVNQTAQLANSIPLFLASSRFDSIRQYIPNIKNSLNSISANLGSVTTNLYTVTAGIFRTLFTIFMILVLTFYMLVDEANIKRYISSIFSDNHRGDAIDVINKVAIKVGSWFRGQMILSLTMFVVHFIGLSIIGVPYALILAIVAGLLEMIPTIGPTITAIISALVALTVSPWMALIVILWFLLAQTLDNIFLAPKIMQKAVGISPVFILLALIIGSKLTGIVGAILAVPTAATISVLILEWTTIGRIFAKE
ncbi:MAG: AI-2E family transporter [Candidatus Berkelbacteria bacterium]|nr:AI-2E family transporter [Candidatus Berkelbacteria bacterium]